MKRRHVPFVGLGRLRAAILIRRGYGRRFLYWPAIWIAEPWL